MACRKYNEGIQNQSDTYLRLSPNHDIDRMNACPESTALGGRAANSWQVVHAPAGGGDK